MADLSENRMIFAENRNIYSIRYDDIIYIEYIDRNVYIHTRENEVIKRNIGLKKVWQELEGIEFIRVYRSIIVNLRYVKRITENEVYLYDVEKTVPVSRIFRRELVKALINDKVV